MLADSSNYEFATKGLAEIFITLSFPGLFLVALFALLYFIDLQKSFFRNCAIAIGILFTTLVIYNHLALTAFGLSIGDIAEEKTLYVNKTHPRTEIKSQLIGMGAMGDDHRRIVQINPLFLWNRVTSVDTAHLDKNEWTAVDPYY
jgi:hypothetical protein